MATWRCPHCATVQAESSRCFLCQRSATSCGTCARFRPSLVGGVGYCASDPRREPLSGSEQRPCWSAVEPLDGGGLFVVRSAAERPPTGAGRGLLDVP